MATLTLGATKAFVWQGTEQEAQEAAADLAGWCKTTIAPAGQAWHYTGDLAGRPMYNPWAALAFYDIADEKARPALVDLKREYDASFALDGPEDIAPLPPGEYLLPFQRAGVAYALRRQHVLIGDPMGLGKSIQALAICNARKAERILILCPAAVLLQWGRFVRRWLLPLRPPAPDPVVIAQTNLRAIHPRTRVLICSYDRAKNKTMREVIEKHSWDHVILDEAHYLRHHTSQRTKAILGSYGRGPAGLVAEASHIIALTGTPLPNRPREAYTLARALDWEAISLMSEQAFQDRFNPSRVIWIDKADGTQAPIIREATGRLPELQARLRCNFLVRREKEAAAPQLPKKTYDIVLVASDETRRVVQAERALHLDIDNLEALSPQITGKVTRLRKEMAQAMVPLVADYLANLLAAEDQKLVVYAYHLVMISELRYRLAAAHPAVVTGALTAQERQREAARFVEDRRCRLFIGQIQAASTGIDGLQRAASTVIFAEPSWVPGENEQAIDRLHRVGQNLPVLAQFLVAEESLNARIVVRFVEKARIQHVALDAALAG